MNRKTALLMGICAVLGTSGCQSISGQSRNLAIQAGKAPTAHLSQAELQVERGRAYLDAELVTLAIGQFRLAQQDPRTLAAASNGLGVAYARIGRHDLAERYFSQAVVAEPGNGRYARNLAVLLDSRPASTQLAAAKPQEAPKAAVAPLPQARPGLTLVRVSRGEVHIGGSAPKPTVAAPSVKLAANDGKAVITVVAPRRPRAAFPVVVKLDQLPGLAQARIEQRPLAMNLLASLPGASVKSAATARAPAKDASYPIVVDLTR